MATEKRLFLLDAFALIFRGYYAFIKNPRINSKGMDVSAIMGFTNSLFEILRKDKPEYLAVCFDKGGSDLRNDMFPEYKSNRQETPEAIKIAVPIIQQMLKAMDIPIIEVAGYEADDLIGTLAKKAEKEGFKTYMVTPDKDFAQLVSENIFMYRPARMGNGIEIWGIPEVQEKFEVEKPEQVIDYLGMMGDAVDNIPGLPGVGDKTAKKFLKAYGSMEGLLANTADLKGKMKEKVEANAELGLLSKKLATILLDCPIDFEAEKFYVSKPNAEEVTELFKELEFRRLQTTFETIYGLSSTQPAVPVAKKTSKPATKNKEEGQFSLFGGDINTTDTKNTIVTGYKTAENTPHFYQFIGTPFARKLFLEKLLQQNSVCFDTETTSLNTFEAELVGIAFSWEAHKGYYIPFPEDQNEAQNIIEELRPFFEDERIEKIAHNIKYDNKVLNNYNIRVKGPMFDTMLAHYLINPDMRHNMDVLAETYLNYQPISIESLIGKKGKNQKSFRSVELSQQTEYAVEDADVTFQLKQLFEQQLVETDTKKLFDEIEMPLVPVLTAMELEGININIEFLNELSNNLTTDIKHLEKNIFNQAGKEFNLASPRQLGVVLFEDLKLVDKPKKTKTGQYSTSEEVLSKLNEHKIIQDVLNWRGLIKLQNTYVDALPNQVNQDTKRIHTDYHQAVAATGRLSSNNPNLQNIPIRTERGRQVRKAFVPKDENHILLAADYSQIELRIIAALSKDQNMIDSFVNKEDIHTATAAKVFGVSQAEVTREQRGNAKAVNFGIIYGQGAFTLAQQQGISRKEAKELIDNYYKTYPDLKAYMANQVDFARDNGYVETISQRRRYLKNINSQNAIVRAGDERNAVNAPIQGSAADIIKLAMINIHAILEKENYQSKMLLQVHDELVFDVLKEEETQLRKMVKEEMENAFKMTVPLDVEVGVGQNWLEAH
ncbi:DNA polymerase I [Pseudofulvibacter geojedonensis]|uniref:DNA polymerase I n=1 Tax=Pseudofulvibacter geojedonensis TaxID=1123758 RepID=A0ABW3I6F0_9FLAO